MVTKRKWTDFLVLGLAIVGALLVIVPFLLILVNSFKSPADYANNGRSRCRPRSTSTASGRSGSASTFR